MTALRVAIVGLGKIARDQHIPAISATEGVTLVAAADPHAALPDLPHFASLDDLLRDGPAVDAVAVCTPPQVRRQQASIALAAGKHVLLEKPPGAGVSEIESLIARASRQSTTLFTAWHSRFGAAVEPARQWLASRRIRSVHIEWKEDVRVWHPGQRWIFEPGGLGVFDPGINALSILTRILPQPVFVTAAGLFFPANRDAPIAASLSLADSAGVPISAEFDFRQTGQQTWDIVAESDGGTMTLASGGRRLAVDGDVKVEGIKQEYRAIYRRFLELSATGASDVDLTPLRLVADAFLLGKRHIVEAFED